MLKFDVALCRSRDNVAHLSALVTRQAGKVRRYKNGCSVGVYLRRWSELVSDVERFAPDRVHVARTNNKQVRLWRISAFLPEASFRVQSRGFL